MSEEKVSIRGVPETMLQTLYARAAETQSGRGLINDPAAVEIVSKLDYDFSKAQSDRTMSSGVIARTILLDRMVTEFLDANPGTTVLNIACGLDTRCCRMEGKYLKWYNLDLPETMELRNRFLSESESVRHIACSAMAPEWIGLIEGEIGNALIIIEGLTMYLSADAVKEILCLIDRRFKKATVFAETMNPWIVKHIKEKSIEGSAAKFSWGVKSVSELQALCPSFRAAGERSLAEGMEKLVPAYKFIGKLSFVRNISNKIMVLEK